MNHLNISRRGVLLALVILAGCGRQLSDGDAGSATDGGSPDLSGVPLSVIQADAGNVTGAIQRLEAGLFCKTGGTLCPDGETICDTNSTCVAGGKCACNYGYTGADCSGTPCPANGGGDCANEQWACTAEPANPYGACVLQSQCPTDCFCGVNKPCYLGVFQCLPQCDPGMTATCPAVSGQPTAWCASSPDSPEGGFCSGTSSCSVAKQDCPEALLNPQEPQSTQNPMVQYTCEPTGPGLNVCEPAGTIGVGLSCTSTFTSACTALSDQCAVGLTCLGNSMEATCYQQCSDPTDSGTPAQSPDCPTGQYCAGTYSDGNTSAINTTGVCVTLPS